jgi:glutamate:Na+ symporter, ESS family
MKQEWMMVLDIALLSILLGVSTLIKSKVPGMKRFPIPIPVIAGFLGLLVGQEALGLLDFNSIRLENLVYHLMSIGFIALSLKSKDKLRASGYGKAGIFIVSTYTIQGIVGFGLTLLFTYTLWPNLFPPMGLLLPLGYGQGPGQAFATGHTWEALGFTNGGNAGLTFAAMGYVWACLGGIPLALYLTKKRKLFHQENPLAREGIFDIDKVEELPHKESIDGLSLQLILIGGVYLLTYLTLLGLTGLLNRFGSFGETLAQLFWGFAFIIGALYGAAVRSGLDVMLKKGIMRTSYTSNYLLERISGTSFDYMITAAISVISISLLADYWLPLLIVCTVGGLVTYWYVIAACRRIYPEETLENTLAFYGMLTGTISTGLALLREVDPHFRSGAARNLVFGSGTGLAFGLPMMLILNLPTLGYKNGQPIFYVYTMVALVVYFGLLLLLLRQISKNALRRQTSS